MANDKSKISGGVMGGSRASPIKRFFEAITNDETRIPE
jgi:hypothetical protein